MRRRFVTPRKPRYIRSMHYRPLITVLACLPLLASPEFDAQRPTLSAAARAYVSVDSPVVALTMPA